MVPPDLPQRVLYRDATLTVVCLAAWVLSVCELVCDRTEIFFGLADVAELEERAAEAGHIRDLVCCGLE